MSRNGPENKTMAWSMPQVIRHDPALPYQHTKKRFIEAPFLFCEAQGLTQSRREGRFTRSVRTQPRALRQKDIPKREIKGSVPRRHQTDCHCRQVTIQGQFDSCRVDRITSYQLPSLPGQGRLKSIPSILARPKVKSNTPSSASRKMAASLALVRSNARLSTPFFPWS